MAAVVTQAAARGQVFSTGSKKAVITLAETNQLASDSCKLAQIVVWGDNAGTACILDVYDDPDSNDSKVYRWVTANGVGVFALQMPMQNGLRLVSAGTLPTNGGFTVVWEE